MSLPSFSRCAYGSTMKNTDRAKYVAAVGVRDAMGGNPTCRWNAQMKYPAVSRERIGQECALKHQRTCDNTPAFSGSGDCGILIGRVPYRIGSMSLRRLVPRGSCLPHPHRSGDGVAPPRPVDAVHPSEASSAKTSNDGRSYRRSRPIAKSADAGDAPDGGLGEALSWPSELGVAVELGGKGGRRGLRIVRPLAAAWRSFDGERGSGQGGTRHRYAPPRWRGRARTGCPGADPRSAHRRSRRPITLRNPDFKGSW